VRHTGGIPAPPASSVYACPASAFSSDSGLTLAHAVWTNTARGDQPRSAR